MSGLQPKRLRKWKLKRQPRRERERPLSSNQELHLSRTLF
jgi:hypothetical protein